MRVLESFFQKRLQFKRSVTKIVNNCNNIQCIRVTCDYIQGIGLCLSTNLKSLELLIGMLDI